MSFDVLLTDDALHDLEDIYDYMATHDDLGEAERVLNEIEAVVLTLRDLPERGNPPAELQAIGSQEYREVFFKPFRIIYRAAGKHVYVYLIADGRSDMQSLLSRRLLS